MIEESKPSLTIGSAEERKQFLEKRKTFIDHLPKLYSTMRKAFTRDFKSQGPADLAIFDLGCQCVETFNEILLLCANGYGIGALKLLRGLYERTVTGRYLSLNPNEAERFWDYFHITSGKQLNHARKIPGIVDSLPAEVVEKIEEEYKRQKALFQETICEKCSTTRTQFSWSSLDIASMAIKANAHLDKLYLPFYFDATMQAHPSAVSLVGGMKSDQDGRVVLDPERQRKHVDQGLLGAHHLILILLETHNNYFNLELNGELQQRLSEFQLIWGGKTN